MARLTKDEIEACFQRAVKEYRECKNRWHDDWVATCEKRYRAYRGVIDNAVEAAKWTSKETAPYIMHIAETTLSSLVDDDLSIRVRPRPMLRTPQEMQLSKIGAEAHQYLQEWQLEQDRFSQIQRPYALQNLVCGLTVAKNFWVTKEARRRRLKTVDEELVGPDGQPLLGEGGAPITIPVLQETESKQIVYDGPTTELVDVRDFGWHEAATKMDDSRYVWHRVYMDLEDVLEGVESGDFGPKANGASLQEIKEKLEGDQIPQGHFDDRENTLWNVDRTRDKVVVVEWWDKVKEVVVTFAGTSDQVLLSVQPEYPFWIEKPPFVVCTTQPDLFRIPGISQVEKIAGLQSLLWKLQNARIDNVMLMNAAIFMFSPEIEDIEQYEFYPGARWFVDDPTKINQWAPNPIPADVSIGAESLLKGDLQNLAGGFPFSSGTDSQVVDQKTATGASIVTSIAQRAINLSKEQLRYAVEEIIAQRVILNCQFVREPTLVPVAGEDDEELIELIMPEMLQGDFDCKIEPGSNALMRAEEQAAANAMLQVSVQAFGPLAMAGTFINLEAIYEDFLRAYGKTDVQRYFSKQPPALMAGAGGAPGGAPAPTGQPAGAGGVTGPQSIDPAVSPSAQVSLSPETMMQRLMAQSGAVNA